VLKHDDLMLTQQLLFAMNIDKKIRSKTRFATESWDSGWAYSSKTLGGCDIIPLQSVVRVAVFRYHASQRQKQRAVRVLLP
jgi:hypothetical protein